MMNSFLFECRRATAHLFSTGCFVASIGLLVSGCTDSGTNPISSDPTRVLSGVILPVPAANLSLVPPYDTVYLNASALLGDGTSATSSDVHISYVASDSTVTVDSSGLVRAHFVTDVAASATVVVTVRYRAQTRQDTARVRVAADAPMSGAPHLSLQVDPDSQPRSLPGRFSANVVVLWDNHQPLTALISDGQGVAVPGMIAAFTSTDTTIATVDTLGVVTGVRPGKVWIRASTVAYGRDLHDSLEFTVTEPDRHLFELLGQPRVGGVRYTLDADSARIVAGGVIVWSNANATPLDIEFDMPPGPIDSVDAGVYASQLQFYGVFPPIGASGSGDIAPFAGDTARQRREQAACVVTDWDCRNAADGAFTQRELRGRRFPVPGRYPFHSNLLQLHGVVVVCEDVCR